MLLDLAQIATCDALAIIVPVEYAHVPTFPYSALFGTLQTSNLLDFGQTTFRCTVSVRKIDLKGGLAPVHQPTYNIPAAKQRLL